MKNARRKGNGNGSRTPNDRQIVEALTAKGLSGDVISEILNVNKNTLRSKHALALHIGRAKRTQKAAEAGDMTRAEMCCADAILSSFVSEWFTADGNDLWPGLHSDNAKTPADAFARWQQDGGRFVTSGISKNFGPERIAEFCKLKAEAEKLLSNGR